MEAAGKVTSIFVYPIKSCRGISVSQAPLTPTGFRWDRQWMVINNKGRAYTQRNEPKLALVQIELPNEAFLEGWEPTGSSYMVIRAPGMQALKIPMSKPCDIADGVSVWEWSGSALDEGAEASNWFTNYLGKSSRLVRYNAESETRPVDPEYAAGQITMFSDGYPFMLLSQGSLDALNKLLKEPVPINRFRPKYNSKIRIMQYLSIIGQHTNFFYKIASSLHCSLLELCFGLVEEPILIIASYPDSFCLDIFYGISSFLPPLLC
ncbi:hypothetical protein CISIN_1g021930mg [Citrus sinensis]|uniref:Molybdenum cofactor sulfurase middle domain-containing protein n=1 Tax=Citrus sinensis TaxID=2711 RepID=A0A067GPA7_CITSI|nr:hypothetical protein CISIN_1g021930mg [Citrus sinensis]